MSQSNFIEMVTAAFEAGESRTFVVSGQYFELIDSPASVDVFLVDRYGAQRGVMRAAEASFNLKATDFSEIQIISPTAQTIRFAYGTGEAGTRRSAASISGAVILGNVNGTFTQNQATVASLSGQIFAPNSARRYLLVQNNDATGIVYVNLSGADATLGNGVKIGPGESLEIQGYAPTGGITAIGSIASNANVVAVEA